MKYRTIGAFKNLQNVGYCVATADMKQGVGVVLDKKAKTAKPSADAVHIVANEMIKPELWTSEEFMVKKGEHVRADDLRTLGGLEIEFRASEVANYSAIEKGQTLVFGEAGIPEVGEASGKPVHFKVLEITRYGLTAESVVA